jgi:hypothetical protein
VDAAADARSDRRTLLVGVAVMLGLIGVGIAFGLGPAGTACRRLDPVALAPRPAPTDGRVDLATVGAGPAGGRPGAADVVPARLAPHPAGVLVTGGDVVLLGPDGAVLAGAAFDPPVAVVGSGTAVYAVVVANPATGQVDALRPVRVAATGVTAGACVDTSAIGSPLTFLLAAGEGQLLALRTDEDGTDAVLELRDPLRGRVWAPRLELGRAPAGILGARTSGGLGPDLAVLVHRIDDVDALAVLAVDRTSGAERWTLTGGDVRAVLPPELAALPAVRLEVAAVGPDVVLLATADVATGAPLPPRVHGPLAIPGTPPTAGPVATVRLGSDGTVRSVVPGAPPVATGDRLEGPGGTWSLRGGAVVRPGALG